MRALFSVLWLLGTFLMVAALLLPVCLLLVLLPMAERPLTFALALPLAVSLGPFCTLLLAWVYYLVLPAQPSGTFRMFEDRGAVLWALANWPSSIWLKWFQGTLFLNDWCRYLALRALRCDVRSTSWITSSTLLSDLQMIHVGADTIVGEHAHLIPSLQPRPGILVVEGIRIGDRCMVGGYTRLGPRVTLGNDVVLEYNVQVYPDVTVGDRCVVGAGSVIGSGVRIGEGVTVGKGCRIPAGTRVPAGATVRRGTEAPFDEEAG